jgi:hypothetical protein
MFRMLRYRRERLNSLAERLPRRFLLRPVFDQCETFEGRSGI